MEQKINIAEILKDAPKGVKLWSDYYGEIELIYVYVDKIYAIVFKDKFSSHHSCTQFGEGKQGLPCHVWPSKDHRTWEDFKPSWKPGHKVFEPFQKVLVHIGLLDGRIIWRAHIYSHYDKLKELHITIDGDHFLDRDIESYEGNENLLGKWADK